MNWTKIKTLIIFFLIGMNIFLIICMALFTYSQNVVPEEVISSSYDLLRDYGFELDDNILPESFITLPSLGASFYSPSELSDIFFGKQLPFRTKGDSLVASENGKTLTVSQNSFSYTGNVSSVISSPAKIKRTLKKAGINMSGAVYDKSTGFFYRMHKEYNLFNMYMKASLAEDGSIAELSAQWPSELFPQKKKRLSFTKNIPSMPEKFPAHGKITNIECGYELRRIGGEKYAFSPSWRVTVDDKIAIFD